VVAASGDVVENYEVQKGDHIDSIARGFGLSREAILSANRELKSPYPLRLGQILKVPVAKAYVAQSGDTLSGVARRFSVDASELAEMNHISSRAGLRAGEEVGLPSSFHDKGPQKIAGSEQYVAAAPPPRSYTSPPPPAPSAAQVTPHGYIAGPPQQPPPPRAPITQESPSAPITEEHGAGFAARPGAMAPESTGLSDNQITAAAKGRFMWPVRGDIVGRFGPQGVGRRNDGVDIKAAQGSDVKAAADGEVVYAGDQVPGYGNLVLIKHADGWVTAYAHLDSVAVQMRQQVTQGQTVGAVGMSGGLTQPQLHFEVRYAPTPEDKAKPVDPVLVLPAN
jgi:murein DD-endopeptidase MepM/ murein hydrolase activator NlpD